MSEPREWWIGKGPTDYLQVGETFVWDHKVNHPDAIHVIEKSAYDQVLKNATDLLLQCDLHPGASLEEIRAARCPLCVAQQLAAERERLKAELTTSRDQVRSWQTECVKIDKERDRLRQALERLKEKDAELIRVLDELLGSGNRVNPHLGVAAGASLLKTRVERLQAALERAKEIIKHQTLIDRTPSLLEEIEKLELGTGATGAEKAQSAAAKERGE